MSRRSRTRRLTKPIGSGPTRRRRRSRQKRHLHARSAIIGAATCRSIAACGISTSSASTIIATTTRTSKPSRPGSTTSARDRSGALADRLRLSRRARRPRRQGDVPRRPAEIRLRFRLQYAAADVCRHPRARGDRASCSISNGSTAIFSTISTSAPRATSTTPICRPPSAGRRARARAARAVSRRRSRRLMDGTWAPPVTDGSGRDRDTLRQALALFEAAGYELNGTELRNRASGRPFGFEILVTDQRRGAAGARLLRAISSAPASRARCAWSTPCNSSSADRFDFDMIEYRWEQSLSPGNEQIFYWARPRPTKTARAIIWA